jgi:hypothetical protein
MIRGGRHRRTECASIVDCSQLVGELHELIAALDRRVPQGRAGGRAVDRPRRGGTQGQGVETERGARKSRLSQSIDLGVCAEKNDGEMNGRRAMPITAFKDCPQPALLMTSLASRASRLRRRQSPTEKPLRDKLLRIERLEERAFALAASFTIDFSRRRRYARRWRRTA